MMEYMAHVPRDTKSSNFPVGRISRAKTFRTECVNRFATYMRQKCVNRFRDKYVPKVRKLLSRHTCQNSSYKSARYGCCNNTANNRIFVGKVSRLFGNFPYSLESFQTVWKLSTLSGNFPHCQENFQSIWKLSGPTGNFPDILETFQTVWQLSRPSGNFPNCPETFQTVRKLSRLSRNFPDCLETLLTV